MGLRDYFSFGLCDGGRDVDRLGFNPFGNCLFVIVILRKVAGCRHRRAGVNRWSDRKLEQARSQRQLRRAAGSLADFLNTATMASPGETEAGSAGMQPC